MRRLLAPVSLLLLWSAAAAAQDDLKEKYDKKLQEPFLKKAAWITDYDKAREESKTSGKAIFAYFTRSYSP